MWEIAQRSKAELAGAGLVQAAATEVLEPMPSTGRSGPSAEVEGSTDPRHSAPVASTWSLDSGS